MKYVNTNHKFSFFGGNLNFSFLEKKKTSKTRKGVTKNKQKK